MQKHETSRQLTIDRSDFSGLRDILLQMVSYANIATNDHGNDDDDDDKVMMLAMVSLECANTDRPQFCTQTVSSHLTRTKHLGLMSASCNLFFPQTCWDAKLMY